MTINLIMISSQINLMSLESLFLLERGSLTILSGIKIDRKKTNKISDFSQEVAEQLKYYVYRLIDPRNGIIV